MYKFLANFGDYDVVKVSKNTFLKVYHENAQGINKRFTILDRDIDIFLSNIREISETEEGELKWCNIDYIEREYIH